MNVTSDTHPRPLALNHRPAFSKYMGHAGEMSAANKAGLLSVEEYQRLVVTLQTRLKDQQSDALAMNSAIEREKKRCRVQGKLIDHLRDRLSSAEAEVLEYELADSARLEFAAQATLAHREQDCRVSSMKGAFMRINGADATDRPAAECIHAKFDGAEFLPVAEPPESSWLKIYWPMISAPGKRIRAAILRITQRVQVQRTEY